VSGRSIRLAASARPAATRAALLGGVWLGALAVVAPDAAFAQQGPFLYAANQVDNNVAVLDTSTNTIVSPSFQAGNVTLASSVAVRGDESMIYVTNFATNAVSVINTAGNTLVASIPVGTHPFGAVVSPDGTRLYVTNVNSNSVSVISTE
jgi:YVTN family beta-propeller protein